MTAAVITLAIALAGAVGGAGVIAWQLIGSIKRAARLEIEVADADRANGDTYKQLERVASDFERYRKATHDQIELLHKDIESLEEELSRSRVPGSVAASIERLRSRSEEARKAAGQDGGAPYVLPRDATGGLSVLPGGPEPLDAG